MLFLREDHLRLGMLYMAIWKSWYQVFIGIELGIVGEIYVAHIGTTVGDKNPNCLFSSLIVRLKP